MDLQLIGNPNHVWLLVTLSSFDLNITSDGILHNDPLVNGTYIIKKVQRKYLKQIRASNSV